MKHFELPKPPASQTGQVKAWSEPVVIPTYHPLPPDKNPMFLENRVYQGSGGRVYPLPFIDRISTEACDYWWQAVHIENKFVRVMVLPEIGGRVPVGLDKTNGYDFFYRQNVIKPALVGLAGPWISGGVEFNGPQHYRPATFMPVASHIEQIPASRQLSVDAPTLPRAAIHLSGLTAEQSQNRNVETAEQGAVSARLFEGVWLPVLFIKSLQ